MAYISIPAGGTAAETSGVGVSDIAEPVELTYFGRSTVLIGLDGVRLLTDPSVPAGPMFGWARRLPPPELPEVDVVLISHGHARHLSVPTLRRLPGHPRILAPAQQAESLLRAGIKAEAVEAGDVVMSGRVAIRALAVAHDPLHAALSPRQHPVGFLIEGSSSVYFAGDSVPSAVADAVTGVDVALLPVAPVLQFVGHLSPSDAAESARVASPRVVVPVHWADGIDEFMPVWMPRRETFTPEGLEAALRRAFATAEVTAELRVLEPGYSTAVAPPAERSAVAVARVVPARRPLPTGRARPA